MKNLVAINGKIFEPSDAKISIFDRGFLYGDSVYEVVRSYNGVLFALEDHVDRLLNSARMIDFDIGMKRPQLIEEFYRVYKNSELADAYVRLIVTRGEGKISLDPEASPGPNFIFIIKEIDSINPEHYLKGIDIITANIHRNPKRSLDPNIKSGNYLNNVLAYIEAKRKKATDAVLLNREGYVTEGTLWNIFIVKNGLLITPPEEADILQGITRKTIKKICAREKIKLEERFFRGDELRAADEAFTSGSVKEIVPIRSVDGVEIGKKRPGPMTEKLSALYRKFVQEYCEKNKNSV